MVEHFLREEDRDVDKIVDRVKFEEWDTKSLPRSRRGLM